VAAEAEPSARKLAVARTRLVLERPFLGALVLRLPLQAVVASWCPTTATDARRIYYNADYIAALQPAEVQFVLAHEALHCALAHFARRGHRSTRRWDVACDYAVNALLTGEGVAAPAGALHAAEFDGLSAEEIYPCLPEEPSSEPQDRHLYDSPEPHGADGAPPPLSESERNALALQWRQRLAGAAQQARLAGRLSAKLARMVDYLLQPQLPWRALLARYLTAVARDDYSHTRPSQRRGDPAIFPTLHSRHAEVAVALDVSGSIDEAELRDFLTELEALKGQVRARVTLLACDAELVAGSPWVYEPWEAFDVPPELGGGGGTRFTPVFEWLRAGPRVPDLLVYFTDAVGEFPQREPPYPVLWLVKGSAPVPWGGRVQLN